VAYEDFNTFTESDEGDDITIASATVITWDNFLTRDEEGYVFKDYGLDHFGAGNGGDHDILFKFQFWNVGNASTTHHLILSTLNVGDQHDLRIADADMFSLKVWDDTPGIRIQLWHGGTAMDNDTWLQPGPQTSTSYYAQQVRDRDGGVNSTGRYTVYIRTGSHLGVLKDTLQIDCAAGEQDDYQYLYAVSGQDSSAGTNVTQDGFIQNLDLQEVASVAILAYYRQQHYGI